VSHRTAAGTDICDSAGHSGRDRIPRTLGQLLDRSCSLRGESARYSSVEMSHKNAEFCGAVRYIAPGASSRQPPFMVCWSKWRGRASCGRVLVLGEQALAEVAERMGA